MIDVMQTEVEVVDRGAGKAVQVCAGPYVGLLADVVSGGAPKVLSLSGGEEIKAAASAVAALQAYPDLVVKKGTRFGIWGTKRILGLFLCEGMTGRVLVVSDRKGAPIPFASDKAAEAVGVDFAEALLPSGFLDWETRKIQKMQRVR